MEIKLCPINRLNWVQCIKLRVSAEQSNFVYSNSISLAQAAYEPETYPFAIYCDDIMVGFIMYGYKPDFDGWELCRMMVDERFQGRGIGKAAIDKLLNIVIEKLGHIAFYVAVDPPNLVAIRLYEKMGFVKTGQVVNGDEILMKTQL